MQRLLEARARSAARRARARKSARAARAACGPRRATAPGGSSRARLRTPEPYELTSWTALALAERATRGELPVGYQTPARACGRGFVLEFPGVALDGD